MKKNLAKAQVRAHEKNEKMQNFEKVERAKEKQSQITSTLKENETYNTGIVKDTDTKLLAF